MMAKFERFFDYLMEKLDRFFYYFLLCVVMLALGYFWAFAVYHKDTDYKQFKRQLEVELKHELQQKNPVVFYVSDTNIQITKQADGTGVIRVVKEGR